MNEGLTRCEWCGEWIEEPKRFCHSCESDIKAWWDNRPNMDEQKLLDYLWEAIT